MVSLNKPIPGVTPDYGVAAPGQDWASLIDTCLDLLNNAKIELGGDLGGTVTAPTVVSFGGRAPILAWTPAVAYAAGAAIVDPFGFPVVRVTAGTSRASYDATEATAWAETGRVTWSRFGIKGDGVTDWTSLIQTVLNMGGVQVVPAGTYMINAVTGLTMTVPGTVLQMSPGAVIQVITNNSASYAAVTVTAADCRIIDGTWLGDVATHTGGTGEWGHLICVGAGGDRFSLQNTRVSGAWGDGINIAGNAADVSLVNVTADNNRRQGCSIIASVRTRVLGGVYKDTGKTLATAPTAGIDVEPNAGGAVVDCLIEGVVFQNNVGPGLQIAAAATSSNSVMVVGCDATAGLADGFYLNATAGTVRARLDGCSATGNASNGFYVNTDKVELTSCTARGNTLFGFRINGVNCRLTAPMSIENTSYGFQINASGCRLTDPVSIENGGHGLQVSTSSAVGTQVIGGLFSGNSQTTSGSFSNIDDFGVGTCFVGTMSDAGLLTNKPSYGFSLRAGSTPRLVGCSDAGNAYATRVINDLSGVAIVTTPLGLSTGVPTAAAGAQAGTSPPAPVVNSGSRQLRGSVTCGTGTSPAAGVQVTFTFASALPLAPQSVMLEPTNAATAALQPYVSAKTTTGFSVSFGVAPAASQANTVYAFDFAVIA